MVLKLEYCGRVWGNGNDGGPEFRLRTGLYARAVESEMGATAFPGKLEVSHEIDDSVKGEP